MDLQITGKVIDILAVADDDEVLMVTAVGKIQRLRARELARQARDAHAELGDVKKNVLAGIQAWLDERAVPQHRDGATGVE